MRANQKQYASHNLHRVQWRNGFTLIELVVVISVIAILMVVGLPRLSSNYESAHNSSVAATSGALASAVVLVKSQWVANATGKAEDQVIGYGSNDIATSNKGWPTDARRGSLSSHSTTIGGDAARCVRLWQSLLVDNAPVAGITPSNTVDYLADTVGSSTCRYRYQNGNIVSQIEYNLTTGSVVNTL